MDNTKIDVPPWRKLVITPVEASTLTNFPPAFFRLMAIAVKNKQSDFPCAWYGTSIKINRPMMERWLEENFLQHIDFKTKYILKMAYEEELPKRGRPRKER